MRANCARVASVLLLLAACGSAEPPFFVGPPARMLPDLPDRCEAARFSALRGEHFTRLASYRFEDHLRILWPQQEITSEIRPRRLNAEVDAAGVILRLSCG